MTLTLPDPRRRIMGRVLTGGGAVAVALTIGALATRMDRFAAVLSQGRAPHWPDRALFAAQPAIVQAHVIAGLLAVGLGASMMLSRKGARFHRVAGRIWAALVGALALSSFFITGFSPGGWSWLHLGSGWVLVFLPLAVLAARRRHVDLHRGLMMLLFYGALLITGALTFLPGRLMWRLVFG